MTYRGNTYGITTDGNVHIHYLRKDLVENADNQKRFDDKHGKTLAFPQTWEDDLRIQQFFHNPDKDIYGSGSLRNRANGATWWYMMFYSAGGFPFDDDINPTINNEAGDYAVEIYLQEKKAAHPELAGWGTPQMIPRIVGGKVASCQYWDGTARLNENKEKSADRRQVAVRPGAGLRQIRQAHPPLDLVAARRDPGQQVQPAQGAGRLPGAVVGNAQELDADRVRQGQHVPRRLAQRPHYSAGDHRELHPGRHEGDRSEPAGGQPADLSDRLPGVPGPARRRTCPRPMSASCRRARCSSARPTNGTA